MGKDARTSNRCHRRRGPDASRSGQRPTVPMQEGHCATDQAAGQADPDAKKKCHDRFTKLNLFNDRGIKEAGLSMSAQIVWDCLWRHEYKGVATISIDGIMKQRNISKRSVYNGISRLETCGMLEVNERGDSRSKCSKYRLFPLPTGATIASVEESATSATIALTGATIALTGATIAPPTEGQKVSGPSVLPIQKGRSGPTDARLGDARSVLPTQGQTNSDGGTIPLCPPSTSMHEDAIDIAFRKKVNEWIDKRLALGEPLETIRTGSRFTIAKGDPHKQRIFDEELDKRRAR